VSGKNNQIVKTQYADYVVGILVVVFVVVLYDIQCIIHKETTSMEISYFNSNNGC